jgi:hypothetical protein
MKNGGICNFGSEQGELEEMYALNKTSIDMATANGLKKNIAADFRKQLTIGLSSNRDGVIIGDKGAVSQGTKKLLDKGLVEDYKLPDNRKEVFFRLTPLGEKVYLGHKKHHGKMDKDFSEYRAGLSEKDLQVICNFFDAATQSIEKIKVTIQSPAGDSENRRNKGAFSPEMSRLGAKGGGSPLC